jgi:hypothetical protein
MGKIEAPVTDDQMFDVGGHLPSGIVVERNDSGAPIPVIPGNVFIAKLGDGWTPIGTASDLPVSCVDQPVDREVVGDLTFPPVTFTVRLDRAAARQYCRLFGLPLRALPRRSYTSAYRLRQLARRRRGRA